MQVGRAVMLDSSPRNPPAGGPVETRPTPPTGGSAVQPSAQTVADLRARAYELAAADLGPGASVDAIIGRAKLIYQWLVKGSA